MFAHIDELGCFFYSPKSGLYHSVRTADKCHHRAVRACARIDIEQRNTLYRFNRIRDLPNDIRIAPFREIRHALDQFLHGNR